MNKLRRFMAAAMALLLLVGLAPAPARAATEELDQSQTDHDGFQYCKASYACAQVFTAGKSGGLSRARFKVDRGDGSGDMVVELRRLSGGQPTGAALATETIPAASVPAYVAPDGSGSWTDVTFSPVPNVIAGQEYALYLSGQNTAEYYWFDQQTSPGSDGLVWLQDAQSSWGAHDTFDFAFETYVTAVPSTRLTSLTLSAGSLSPVFDPDVNAYSAVVPNSTSSLLVTPTTEDAQATVTVNGMSPSSAVSLFAGGTTNIDVEVTASDGSTIGTYTIAVTKNKLPTVSGLSNQTIAEDTATATIPFTISDEESPESAFTAGATSQDEAIVPTDNISMGGSGANRTIKVTPAPNATGTATIEVQVGDGTDVFNKTFTVTVTPVNDPPSIAEVDDQSAPEDGPVIVPFTVDDPDGTTGLTITATSGDPAVVPDANLAVTGTGTDRTLTITPGAASGSTSITVTVSDGTASAATSFDLTLIEVNDTPTIAGLGDKTAVEDAPLNFSFTVADEESPAGSLTVTVTSSNTALLPNNAEVTNENGIVSVSMTPVPDQIGTSTITVEVSDGEKIATGSFTVTYGPFNDPPTIQAVPNQNTPEDTAIGPIAVTIGDVDTPLSELVFTTSSSNQALVPDGNIVQGGNGANRTVTITPAPDQNGTVTINLRVSDGATATTRTFDLVIHPVNDPPTIQDIADVAAAQGLPVPPITFSVGDLETLANSLQVSASSSNQALVPNGNLNVSGSGPGRTLTISPMANQTGTTEISVTVNDGTTTTTDTFVLFISKAPTISTITAVTVEEDAATDIIGFTVDDAETPASDLFVDATSSNETLLPRANITLGGSGANRTMILQPAQNQFGSAEVTISVNDGTLTTHRSFTFTVTPINDPPTISAINDTATAEDVPTGPLAFVVHDPETTGGSLVVTKSSSNKTLVPDANITVGGTGGNRFVNVRPAKDLFGTTIITLTVSDGQLSDTTSFVLTVTSVNDAPVISAPNSPSVLEDGTTSINLTATDPDGPTTALVLVEAVSQDQARLPDANINVAGGNGSWTLTVTPTPNASGVVKIRVTVTDGETPGVREISLNIVEVNDLPSISVFANQVTDEDLPTAAINFTVDDLETPLNNLQTYGSSDNPSLVNSGSFTFTNDGANRTVVITPRPDAHGTATITITVDDGKDRVSQTFLLTVNSIPDAPRLSGLQDRSIDEDKVLLLNTAIVAPDSNLGDVVVTIQSSNQELVPNSAITFTGSGVNRVLSITPTAEASGTALITFTATDGVLTGTQTMLLTVLPVNDTPFISIVSDRDIFEDGDTGAVPFTVGDVEIDPGNLIVTGTSANQQIVPDANIIFGGSGPTRTVTVVPAPHRFGKVTITLRVSDGESSAAESFLLTVDAVNDPPSFTMGPNLVVDEDAGTQTIRDWATNISSGPFETEQITFEINNNNPSLFAVEPALSAAGILTFTPAADVSGVATVNVRLKDTAGTLNGGVDVSAWQSFTITILPVNDPPTITPIPAQGTEEGVATRWLDFRVDDVESAPGALWVTATSSDQSLVRDQDIHVRGTGADRQVMITPQPGKIGTVTITLTVHDGENSTPMSFSLTVNDLRLSELIPEVGALTPVFDSNTLEYTLIYLGSRSTIRLTPRAADPDVEITVNGWLTGNGQESDPIPLEDVGGRTQIVVTAPASGLSKTYSVRFVRALSKISHLADLIVTPGELSPAFDPDVTKYSVSVENYVTAVEIEARPGDGRARVEIEGDPSNLRVGSNRFRIRVRAENGESRLYEVTVIRGQSPLAMRDVEVEAGVEWATVRFVTTDSASATVSFRESGGTERSDRSSGTSHRVDLGPLTPSTTYSFTIVASRGGEQVDFTSTFTTADPTAPGLCEGGAIQAEGPRTASVHCPESPMAVSAATQALSSSADSDGISAAPITDVEVREALRQAGITERTDEPATMVVLAGTAGQVQAAVLDNAAVARVAQMGADLEVRAGLGSLTIPTVALASLSEKPGRLLILFEEVPANQPELEPFLGDGQLRRASSVVDVSVATLYDDGRLERHTRFDAPVRLTLRVQPSALEMADRLSLFWLKENATGTVVERAYVGGQVDPDAGTITARLDHLSKYVALLFDFQFEDVPPSHWAFDVVHQMAARQVIRGKTENLFAPEAPVTRAQFAAMLVRGLGLEKDERFAYVYSDIKKGDPLAGEIGGAVLVGLMLGYPDGTFQPDAQLTRQELAVILQRLASRYPLSSTVNGLDYTARLEALQDWEAVAPWAREAVRQAITQGLMTGRSPEAFSPTGIANRAEAATVVKRFMDWIESNRR